MQSPPGPRLQVRSPVWCPTCPSAPASVHRRVQRLTRSTSAPFQVRVTPLSGQLSGRTDERSRLPPPGFLSPFSHRRSLLGPSCSRQGVGLPYGRATTRHSGWTLTGFPRSAHVRPGWVGRPLHPGRQWCPRGRHVIFQPPPAAFQRHGSYHPGTTDHSRGSS